MAEPIWDDNEPWREYDTAPDLMLPVNLDDSECYKCQELADKGTPLANIREDHARCHGWSHCGIECCGDCPRCGR